MNADHVAAVFSNADHVSAVAEHREDTALDSAAAATSPIPLPVSAFILNVFPAMNVKLLAATY
jgi:hypothetical protein